MQLGSDLRLEEGVAILTWDHLIFWPSSQVGTATVSGQTGKVRSHTRKGFTVFRFIPDTPNPELDAFYSTYSNGTLSDLITTRG